MTLPPSQNQYPGWQPNDPNIPNGPAPIDPNQPMPMSQPMQPTQQAYQPMQQAPNQYAPTDQMAPSPEPITEDTTGKSKLKFKGPLIAFAGLIGMMIIITVIALMSSSGSGNKNQANKSVQSNQPASNQTDQQASSQSASSADQQKTQPNKTFTFINNAQQDNLKNLMTKIITKQGQTKKRLLIPATEAGWASLQASDVVDPVTHKPYGFTTSNEPEVGQVKYAQASICTSDFKIVDGSDTTSFALKTRLFDGTYYCVDSKNISR